MIGNSEFSELLKQPLLVDLVDIAHEKSKLPAEVLINGRQVGHGKWEEILEATREDGRERGLAIVRPKLFLKPELTKVQKWIQRPFLSGTNTPRIAEIKTSEISVGSKLVRDEASVQLPSAKLFLEELVSHLHSHPEPTSINPNLSTTMFSDIDLSNFANHLYCHCEVMIDSGGVHMLLREKQEFPYTDPFPEDLVDQSLERGGVLLEGMKKVANRLERAGMRYYFSPSHQLTEDGNILVKDVRKYQSLTPLTPSE